MKGTLVFIGAGNMAEALLQGILSAGLWRPEDVCLTDVRPERLAELKARFGVRTSTDNAEAVRGASVIFLCVKPQQIPDVLSPLKGAGAEALWVSIAAGVTLGTIEHLLGEGCRVVRVMPNTPALVQCGAAGYCGGTHASEPDLQVVQRCLESVGMAVRVSEPDLHAVTALSGSGPAYVFYLVEAMLQGGASLGMDPETARALVVQTVKGAAELLTAQPTVSPGELRERVTSKGGTTAAAIAEFNSRGVGEGLTRGVLAAAARSVELAGE
ncbi:MAG: pyrroline-5-carboxylate reductase [Verrucomicrobia bacterium]|nr:pyrroline-5-carboxylate reductase [Verrucomicrobiota bacterium]MCH8526890.1 pyrroline-5-carboxylate reductase [Kiritimatiellia bacterium]